MKSSIIRGVMLFAAGAGCATVIAGGGGREIIPAPVFEQRLRAWMQEGVTLGQNVVYLQRGFVGVMADPIACPPPPDPKLPAYAVDPWYLKTAYDAGTAANLAYMTGQETAVHDLKRCGEVPPG